MRRASLLLLAMFAQLSPAQSIDGFFKETFEKMLAADPQFATTVGRHEYDDRWTNWTASARAERRRFFEQRLSMLGSFSASDLPDDKRLTLRLIEYDFRSRLEAWDIEDHLLSVGQLFGIHNRVYLVVDRMPTRTVQDYRNVIARLRGIPAYVDQNIGILDEAIAIKMMQPRVVADLVTEQIASQMNQDSEHTELLKGFRSFPSNIPTAEQQKLRDEARDAYDKQFVPAWHKLHQYMATTYSRHVRPRVGINSIPGGDKAYTILVRRLTTTNLTPEAIHKLGLQEVSRIESAMQGVLKEAGFRGTVADFEQKLNASPEQHFRSSEEMLAYCRNIAKIIEPELPRQFRHIPVLLYGIRAIPPDREAATASNAQSPAPDFSAPGWFNLNTYRPEMQVKYDKESLVLHEAVPGHIFQGSVAISQSNLPDIRKFYSNSAYGEGWALYVELLGSQLGVYRDAYSRFGQLVSERFRAVRLVVDTGLHQLGWTRESALDYFSKHAPEQAASEIDRYISWPGQALSYKIGELRIRELRSRAQQQLGQKFDIREFHDSIIRDGRLPLDLLSERINETLKAASAR